MRKKKGKGRVVLYLGVFFLYWTYSFLGGIVIAASTETERTEALVERAKKEGKVVWYTTLTTAEADKMGKKFNEKYPFIIPEVYRGGSEQSLQRILGEIQAKRYLVDVVMITGPESQILLRKGFFTKYSSPQRQFYPEGLKDVEGYWTDLYMNVNAIGYNTRLVAPRDVPKTYQDLLLPRWKGKMGMDTKAYDWFAHVLKLMGEKNGIEYMKKLGEQDIQFRNGRSLNTQLVAAGELDLSITCYNQRIEEMKTKGAPVNWIAIEPVIIAIHPLSVVARAPHPNAARLLVDYLLSKEGQGVIASFFWIPSRMDVDPIVPAMKKGLRIMPPDLSVVDEYQRYAKLYRELLMHK